MRQRRVPFREAFWSLGVSANCAQYMTDMTARVATMLKSIKATVARSPVNTSRHYLRKWAQEAAAVGTDKTFRVLDAGAGDAPYRELFEHVHYETADLATYTKDYSHLNYVCDVTDMPMPDETFDMVFCSQTLEHVKEPIRALSEMGRVLKPGGQLWLTAPLFYEEHEQPYDFFRYTQYGWRHMAQRAGLEVRDIGWLEGYFGTVSYQLHMAARTLPMGLATRALLLHLARNFARKDLRVRITDRGMCKNYRVTMVKPSESA